MFSLPGRISRLLLLAPLAAFLIACSHAPAEDPNITLGIEASHFALAMIGKPYRPGGNTPAGFDCSGLVQYSYQRAGLALPHGTLALRRIARPVARRHLQQGDLLFFTQDGKKSSHVALYIGDGRFVHAPSSGKKVDIATIDDAYWQRHFNEARRVEAN